jgi:hypothetical protein
MIIPLFAGHAVFQRRISCDFLHRTPVRHTKRSCQCKLTFASASQSSSVHARAQSCAFDLSWLTASVLLCLFRAQADSTRCTVSRARRCLPVYTQRQQLRMRSANEALVFKICQHTSTGRQGSHEQSFAPPTRPPTWSCHPPPHVINCSISSTALVTSERSTPTIPHTHMCVRRMLSVVSTLYTYITQITFAVCSHTPLQRREDDTG